MSSLKLHEDFTRGLGSHWRRMVVGDAALELTGSTLRLVNRSTSSRRYANAQIDDYQGRSRSDFLWRPPLALTVRARFSHPGPVVPGNDGCDDHQAEEGGSILGGTAGFGFWNDPFMMTGRRLPTLPRAIWFFYASPPSNMKLDLQTPGCGWKAATIDALGWPFLLLLPTLPIAVPLMHVRRLYRLLWPLGQRAIKVSEAALALDMTEWHTYVIEWGSRSARFLVDDALLLDCHTAPRGPLGLVIWLDNQTMVVTPQGRLRHGLLARSGGQWLELDTVIVT